MDHKILENGNLKFCLTEPEMEKSVLETLTADGVPLEASEHEWFGCYFCNCDIEFVDPWEIAALTAAPIIGVVERNDHGDLVEIYGLWWFPDYALRSPLDELLRYGEVTFTKGE